MNEDLRNKLAAILDEHLDSQDGRDEIVLGVICAILGADAANNLSELGDYVLMYTNAWIRKNMTDYLN